MTTATAAANATWARDNQRHLALAAAAVAAQLDGRPADVASPQRAADLLSQDVERDTGHPVGLIAVAKLFALTRFEADLLLACAAPELGLPAATGTITFARALALLPDPHWSAVLPDAPLRRWRLLDVPQQIPAAELGGLSQVPLAVDERVLHALVGADTIDDRLAGRARAAAPTCRLTPSQERQARGLAALLAPAPAVGAAIVAGEDRLTRRQAALTAGAALGLSTLVVDAADAPDDPAGADLFARLLAREGGLAGRLVLIEATDPALPRGLRLAPMPAGHGVPTVLSVEDVPPDTELPAVRVTAPTTPERAELFAAALAEAGLPEEPELAERHPLTAAEIAITVSRAVRTAQTGAPVDVAAAARAAGHRPLHGLAELRRPHHRLDDLVLPEQACSTLAALLAHVRQRQRVHGEWGYDRRDRGLAITALFTGPSGTGKTTAAEAVAGELGLDLIAVDLSQVISKYLGDTEKNLARLFDAAESGAVLLFDEGDALFAKRTEVRDHRDRYANLEVSYLLQRLEAFAGIAILTSNARENIDAAFSRRMRFVVAFPFPDAAQRARLWQHAFPAGVPTQGLDTRRLAQLSVTGGTIAQLALHAAFLAADAGEPVGMAHVLAAAQIEAAKVDRPLSPQEIKGWVP
jgi:hypothetical protein